jgi:rhodanese-related sulfurtransferase
MADIEAIKKAARDRGKELKLPYAGALLPKEAHEMMKAGAKLVDVRTRPELEYVGSIPGSATVEWETYPGSRRNPAFLEQLAAVTAKDDPVMFICRSGVRSHHSAAAAAQAGWAETYNVLEGFEGKKDADGHRNTIEGWRVAGLPWKQG